jgi:WD40 repeat protein
MSIPQGRTSYFGRYEDSEKFRLINQDGVRIVADPANLGYHHCWGMNVSPFDGTLYISLANENVAGQLTRLVSYNHAKDEVKLLLKIEDVTLPTRRQLPHSKLHESIDFLPDGKMIAATHSTGRSPHQPEWMPFAHVDHIYEGYPGSTVITYDPGTGHFDNLGIPVPRESIYGACYEAKYNAYYMIGFMRGHVYRFSLDDKTVKDLGKAAELFCYRLHPGPDGHIYGMTKSGYLFRVNVDTQELEDLRWRMPAFPDNFVNNSWYRYMSQACNVSGHEFVFTASASEDIFLFDTKTLKVHSLGKRGPVDYVNDYEINPWSLDEITIDKYGVLWYALSGFKVDRPVDEFYRAPGYRVLVRWDFQSGKKPEALGLMGTQEHNYTGSSVMCIDKERDIFYCIGSSVSIGGKPEDTLSALFCIDLGKFRPRACERGPIWNQSVLPVPYKEEEIQEIRRQANEPPKWAGEDVAGQNPFQVVPLDRVIPVRLWRMTPEVEDSRVMGLAWDDAMCVHGVCGGFADKKAKENEGLTEKPLPAGEVSVPAGRLGDGLYGLEERYYFKLVPRGTAYFPSKEAADADQDVMVWRTILKGRIKEREENGKWAVDAPFFAGYVLEKLIPCDKIDAELRLWLEKNLKPEPVLDTVKKVKLPEVAGRRYLSVPSATAVLGDGRIAAGTRDGLFAVIKDGKAFSYGNAAPLGPVRCLCVTKDGKTVYGTAGDVEDMGTVFCFDDEEGLRQMGLINYNSPGWMDGPSAANVLSAIAVSPDGQYLAVGGADRIGSVHILKINQNGI